MKKITAYDAHKLTHKSRVRHLLSDAYEEIKTSARNGKYRTKVSIVDVLDDISGIRINEDIYNKLISLGYEMGSTENGTIRNITWRHEVDNK